MEVPISKIKGAATKRPIGQCFLILFFFFPPVGSGMEGILVLLLVVAGIGKVLVSLFVPLPIMVFE